MFNPPPNTPTPDERARLIEELRKASAQLERCIEPDDETATVDAPKLLRLLTQAADQLALAGEDSKRMDWLETHVVNVERGETWREAIDSAISATQKETG